MRVRYKALATVPILAVLILLYSACGDAPNPANLSKAVNTAKVVKIGSFFTAIDYAPYLVAKNQRWFEDAFQKAGATVEYTTFQSLAPINESFATNQVDVVFEAEPPAIIGRAGG